MAERQIGGIAMSVAGRKRTFAGRRWRGGFVALALVLLAVAAGVIWWTVETPLSDDERKLVGTWRMRWAGDVNDLPLEYEFRSDRTCVIRHFDRGTGAITGVATNLTWRLKGGTLVVRHPDGTVGPRWDAFGLWRSMCEVLTLTPDGPDRFLYTGAVEAGGATTAPPVSGIMIRSEASH
jgi:hypothetical protein